MYCSSPPLASWSPRSGQNGCAHRYWPKLCGPVAFTDIIEQSERRPDKTQRITLPVIKIANLVQASIAQRVRIRLHKSTLQLRLGDAIRIKARLRQPPPPTLPHGYDFARAAYFKGIGAVGFALSPPVSVQLPQAPNLLSAINLFLHKLRRKSGDRIEAALPGEVDNMANALMMGERSGISRTTNDLYRPAGIYLILYI
jgi:competence protein ComEC